MVENSSKNKTIAWVVLSILVSFLIYLTFVFIPGWLWYIEHSQGQATIQSVDIKNKLFVYSYFNIYESDTIQNQRKVDKIGDLDGIEAKRVIPITYSKYQSGYVRFKFMDSEPMLTLTVAVYLLTIIGILLYVGVLRNKISLETLAGVRKPEEIDEEE